MTVEPVEIHVTRDHAYTKATGSKRGCKTCGGARYARQHIGHADSFNAMGSGSQWTYQAMKKGWTEALALALEASGLPRGLSHVLVEGQVCFPDRRRRDQGNARFVVEKALGDVLVHGCQTVEPPVAGGWLWDDAWGFYEFGGLAHTTRKDESWTRLMLFPTVREKAA